MLDIVIAELIEGNYVLCQGDLSTSVLEKLMGLEKSTACAVRTMAWPWKISNNASPSGPAKTGPS
ncbi:phosphoenolpyruvate synthase [Pseudomonas daroniae]|uniref:Phosphoenolpyruvate synthase n=1 Tax=Phytopseudomonas daroniae TaxID=2487519 RepID=A0A4Q9QHT0_9GAMM|nr:phosphoenolpyruvate synthase [Pseudomonas daroniae]TBU74244.1 phosphoenolpyruvate synthase [Pseudomonas daroniae]TBU75695.1 phosphoenolpyruvate synthase [Pseudomonas sp. FRB 228]TBU87069.1 phosphoenolpyruvate synthase [Pseudomonas daroniae]